MTSFFIILLLITACASAAVHVIGRLRERPALDAELPPLVLPMADGLRSEVDASPAVAADPALESEPMTVTPAAAPDVGFPDIAADTGETIHLPRLAAEPIQLLPARLEVVAGMPPSQEIRFVRTPGHPPHMILGREPGSSPHHVTLASRTVSRRHARVAFTNGKWTVVNLSKTNPVVVNDRVLSAARGRRTLSDGDKIELGDVVLRFRAS